MKEIKAILSRLFEVPEAAIIPQASPKTIENWDSFNGLMLISELERSFNVKLSMDEITGIKCVKDIIDILKKHGVAINDS